MKEKLLGFIIGLIILFGICLLLPKSLFQNNKCFDRLEVIQTRLIEISSERNQLNMDITTLKQRIEELNYEEESLNEEALNLFNSFITNSDKEEEKMPVCDYLIQQELDNIKAGIQDEVGFYHLIANAGCEYDGELPTKEETEREPGQLTEDGTNQVMPEVQGETSHEKFKSLANAYGLNPSVIWEVENHYGLTEGMVLCITIAETSGGKFGAGENNIGNVGNTDSNPRGNSYSNIGASLDAIGRTLTNRYLGKKQTLGCLSNRHHCEEVNDNGSRYATSSPETSGAREPNMVACLSQIYGTIDPSTFNIRNR